MKTITVITVIVIAVALPLSCSLAFRKHFSSNLQIFPRHNCSIETEKRV